MTLGLGKKEIGGAHGETGTEDRKPGGRWWGTTRPGLPIVTGGSSEEGSATDRRAGVLFVRK